MPRFFLALFLLLPIWSGAVLARDIIVIGVENQYYLPAYAYDNGRYRGFARDLFDAWAQDRGFLIEYRALPVLRLYASFYGGQVDLKFPDNPNWKKTERAGKSIVYSEPVAAFVDGTSVRPERLGQGTDAMKVLGTMGGFTPWAWLDKIKSGKTTLSENFNLDALLRQALAGRIDGVYASVAVVHYQLDHVLKQPGALVFDAKLPYSRDHYYLSSLRRPDLIRDFDDWMRQNRTRVAALKRQSGVEKGLVD